MTAPPTRRQRRDRQRDGAALLLEVERYRRQHGIGISYDELNSILGYGSKDKVKRDLDWCRSRDWATYVPKTARSIRVLPPGLEAIAQCFPGALAGPGLALAAAARSVSGGVDWIRVLPADIAAGPATNETVALQLAHARERLPLPAGAISAPERCFAVRVRGDSMRDAHILDGDLVVLRSTDAADRNQIVAVVLPDEGVTLKRYVPLPKQGIIRFQAENPAVPHIDVPIRGDGYDGPVPRIIGVFKTLHRGLTLLVNTE